MRFTKMHGAGNDYVYVNCFEEPEPADPKSLAIQIADRHKGVGGDGLILICPSDKADARMRMFNADGSEAEMCGNGIRCVAKYVYDHEICRREKLNIETGAGVLSLELQTEPETGLVDQVRVDMGIPVLTPDEVPTKLKAPSGDGPAVNVALEVEGEQLVVTCVSMGNPHCITFVDQVTDDHVFRLGPKIEKHAAFPNRVNAEFIEVLSPSEVRMRVWERGSGETQACGTGACAVCVAGVLSGRTERRITVRLLGGDLQLEWGDDDHVYMTGPATEVFSGDWNHSV